MEELLILARAVHFGACLVLLAVFAVRLLIERPAPEDRGPARLPLLLCLVAAAASGFLWFWVSSAGMSGGGLMESLNLQLFQVVVTQTPPGQVWVLRSGIALALGVVICLPGGRWKAVCGVALAALLTGSLAWLGHAGAGSDGRRVWMLSADVAHLLAAALWPAGLLPFSLLLRRLWRARALPQAYAAVRRFSSMSLFAVAVLIASGLLNAFYLVGGWHGLITSTYGRLLMLKVALFVFALFLGALNLLIYKPHLETAPHALATMRGLVWIEAGFGTGIVMIVAIMGTLPPGSSPAG
jgi:putative copper resistance protein D